jgi:hypothetical protein
MRSVLLIVACIVFIILAIKKFSAQIVTPKQIEKATVHSNIIKDSYALLPEEFKMLSLYNY